jgi:hypothetical protein
MVIRKNLEATMEVRRTFSGSAVSRKGFGVALMGLIVGIGGLLAISLASAQTAKPSAATAPSHMVVVGQLGEHAKTVGSAGLTDRESGQPIGAYVEPANGARALP